MHRPFFKNFTSTFTKQALLSLGAALAIVTQLACTPAQGKNAATTMILGTSADYPPFEFFKRGEIVGMDVDLAKKIAQELGVELVIKEMDFSALIPALQTGQVDFIMSGLTITQERKQNVEFSDVYYTNELSLVSTQQNSFRTLKDLADKKIGVQLGSVMEKFAQQQTQVIPGLQVISRGKTPLLIEELKTRRIDGILVEKVQAVALSQANSSLKPFFLPELESNKNEGYAIAFSKRSPRGKELRDQFNIVLKRLQSDGTLQGFKQKWIVGN